MKTSPIEETKKGKFRGVHIFKKPKYRVLQIQLQSVKCTAVTRILKSLEKLSFRLERLQRAGGNKEFSIAFSTAYTYSTCITY